MVHAVELLISQGHDVKLDVIGDGPLRESISFIVVRNSLQEHIHLHGQVANPYPLIAVADAFILPSRSEGVSRAALEALHLGVPCVLRDVDGNVELLSEPGAGVLFLDDRDLPRAMIEAASRGRTRSTKSSLLPPSFRQTSAAMQYLELLEGPV
jgi:glycosyltransferase involved in cell wall biosynthesis